MTRPSLPPTPSQPTSINWWTETIIANPMLWDETVMGIDWGESDNAWALVGYQGHVIAQGSVKETPEGLQTILDVLDRHHKPGHPNVVPSVAIETPRRLLASALWEAGVDVVPLNPLSVKAARRVQTARNASKTDHKDALLIANVLRNNPSYYRSMSETSDTARAIQLLSKSRADAIQTSLRIAARLRSTYAEYLPNASRAFTVEDMAETLTAYHVLKDALTAAEGRSRTVPGIKARLTSEGGYKLKNGIRIDALAQRVADTLREPTLRYPEAFENAFVEVVRTDLEVLRAAVEHRMRVEERYKEAVEDHPMFTMLIPAKGAKHAVIGGLIAGIGDDPKRFATPDNLAAFVGSAPGIDQSGGVERIGRRAVKGNETFNMMYLWASSVINDEPGAKHYYWTLRKRGCKHNHAIRKIINKLLRGVHSCMRHGTIWEDELIWGTTITPAAAEALRQEVKPLLEARKKKQVQHDKPSNPPVTREQRLRKRTA